MVIYSKALEQTLRSFTDLKLLSQYMNTLLEAQVVDFTFYLKYESFTITNLC